MRLTLQSERLGPLPIVNHFLSRLGLEELLDSFVPTIDRRCRLPYAKGIGVLVRSILVEREPIYRQQETVSTFAHEAFGLDEDLVRHIGDDAIGRSLDRLFDADRGTLLTEVVVTAAREFNLKFDELHNDSTTVRFTGQYRQAVGRRIRGKRAPLITYGYSKDHRPDLKQLLFILTTTDDGGVPIQFRCEAGNRNDSVTHRETWDTLRALSGSTDFLYVADSKLCSREMTDHIDQNGGRFVTVLPRSRLEDREFREWIQAHDPDWEAVIDRPNPRRKKKGPRDVWKVHRHHLPSSEGWPVIWVHSTLLALKQQQTRRERIARAQQDLEALLRQITSPRSRLRKRSEIHSRIEDVLRHHRSARYVKVKLRRREQHSYKQTRPGRPGPNTKYIRKTKRSWHIEWSVDEDAIAYDKKSDGMYPLLTNDRGLSPAQVLEAHKRQPIIEKRFEQTKTVFEIAPVLLKNEGRIEALFAVYFLALLVQALIERELRLAMKREGIQHLPLYPEERKCRRPTAEQILKIFSLAQRHTLMDSGESIKVFDPELSELQHEILRLLCVPAAAFNRRR